MGRLATWPSRIFTLMASMKITAYTGSSGRLCQSAMPSITRSVIVRDRLLGHLRAVDLGQVRGDLPVGQPFRRQGNHHVVDPGQPPLPFGDDFRLEAGIPVPRHRDLHRPGLGEHRLGPAPVAGIAAIAAFRVVLGIAEVIIQLAFQGALDHHLGQPAQQAALAGQLQPAGPGPLGQLAQQLLIGRRQLRLGPGPGPVVTSVTGVSSVSGVTPLRLQSRPRRKTPTCPPRDRHVGVSCL